MICSRFIVAVPLAAWQGCVPGWRDGELESPRETRERLQNSIRQRENAGKRAKREERGTARERVVRRGLTYVNALSVGVLAPV